MIDLIGYCVVLYNLVFVGDMYIYNIIVVQLEGSVGEMPTVSQRESCKLFACRNVLRLAYCEIYSAVRQEVSDSNLQLCWGRHELVNLDDPTWVCEYRTVSGRLLDEPGLSFKGDNNLRYWICSSKLVFNFYSCFSFAPLIRLSQNYVLVISPCPRLKYKNQGGYLAMFV